MNRILSALSALAFLAHAPAQAHHTGGHGTPVTATVYHHSLNGGPNYCDETPYQHWGVSAASSWIPCGARVRVTHRGRSLVVRIKDRCLSCDLDLSAGAASRLGVPLDGIATVRISY